MLAVRIYTGALIVSAHHYWMGGATSLSANYEAWISLVNLFFGAHVHRIFVTCRRNIFGAFMERERKRKCISTRTHQNKGVEPQKGQYRKTPAPNDGSTSIGTDFSSIYIIIISSATRLESELAGKTILNWATPSQAYCGLRSSVPAYDELNSWGYWRFKAIVLSPANRKPSPS